MRTAVTARRKRLAFMQGSSPTARVTAWATLSCPVGGVSTIADRIYHHATEEGPDGGQVLRRDPGGRQARVEVPPAVGHRHVRASRAEPARRGRDGGAAERDDAEEDRVSRRRRSLHFVPGGNERMLAKALTLPADGLILDLEDA